MLHGFLNWGPGGEASFGMSPHLSTPPHDWREGRRLQAWELHLQGWTGRAIATALGISPSAVSQWLSRARQGGREALRRRPAPGPHPRLVALLARGAEAFGFRGELWTTRRVATVIADVFGVRYHPAHVSRLLRALGWSPQQPEQRASQRDEAAIRAWCTERWPALQAKPRPRGGPSSGSTNPAFISCRQRSAPTPHVATRPACGFRSAMTTFRSWAA